MVTLNVYNRQGESVGTVDVDPAEFGGAVNKQLLHDVVLQYLANQRAGTHSTLRSKLPEHSWVFCWDERRRTGYLLAVAHGHDGGALRFHIDYTPRPKQSAWAEDLGNTEATEHAP